MTKKEKEQLTPENSKLLKGLYVHEVLELLEQVGGDKDTFTFEEMLEGILKGYKLGTLRAKQWKKKFIYYKLITLLI